MGYTQLYVAQFNFLKAFDVVSRKTITKLEVLRNGGKLLKWIENVFF
jgi:hypothetical protein